MVLEEATVDDSTPSSTFDSDNQPIDSNDVASTSMLLRQVQLPAAVDVSSRKFPFFSLAGNQKDLLIHNSTITDGLRMSAVTLRPPRIPEWQAFAASNQQRQAVLSCGLPIGVGLSSYYAYRFRADWRFPFYKPDMSHFNPNRFFGIFQGAAARMAWHVGRAGAYSAFGTPLVLFFVTQWATVAGATIMATDPRLRDYGEAVSRLGSKETLRRVDNLGRLGGISPKSPEGQKELSYLLRWATQEATEDDQMPLGLPRIIDPKEIRAPPGPAFSQRGSFGARPPQPQNQSQTRDSESSETNEDGAQAYQTSHFQEGASAHLYDQTRPTEFVADDASPSAPGTDFFDQSSTSSSFSAENSSKSSRTSDSAYGVSDSGNYAAGDAWARVRRGAGGESPRDTHSYSNSTSDSSTNVPVANAWARARGSLPLRHDEASNASPDSGNDFSFSQRDEERSFARGEAQNDFDARVERERGGGDFDTNEKQGRGGNSSPGWRKR